MDFNGDHSRNGSGVRQLREKEQQDSSLTRSGVRHPSKHHPQTKFQYNPQSDILHQQQASFQNQSMSLQPIFTDRLPYLPVPIQGTSLHGNLNNGNNPHASFMMVQDISQLPGESCMDEPFSTAVYDDHTDQVDPNCIPLTPSPFGLLDLSKNNDHSSQPAIVPIDPTFIVRKSRSHFWPRASDPPLIMHPPTHFMTVTIGHTGEDSGRNKLALMNNALRTRYNIRVLRGRGSTYLPNVTNYPACTTAIPGGMTLENICRFYPRHVWGTGLRLFIAEGWTGERIYNSLPADFRDSKAVARPWNYIQQGFTREVRRMALEDGRSVPQGRRRKRNARCSALSDIDDDIDETMEDAEDVHELYDVAAGPVHHIDSGIMPSIEISPIRHIQQPMLRRQSNAQQDEPANHIPRAKQSAEIAKQHPLYLAIMRFHCAKFATEPQEAQQVRIAAAKRKLGQTYGTNSQSTPFEDVSMFTECLQEDMDYCTKRMPRYVDINFEVVADRTAKAQHKIN